VLASRGISLEPGTYFVTARLPDGSEETRSVLLGNPQSTVWKEKADVTVPVGQAFTVLIYEPSSTIQGTRAAAGREDLLPLRTWSKSLLSEAVPESGAAELQLETMGTRAGENVIRGISPDVNWLRSVPGRVQWYVGNPLSNLVPRTDLPDHLDFETPLHVNAPSGGTLIAQWQRPRQLALNMVLPVCAPIGCNVVTHFINGEQPRLDVILDNSEADTLLRYLRVGLSSEAVDYFNAQIAQRLLDEKTEDPMGALIGAYVLLRFTKEVEANVREADRWEQWTENLQNNFANIPDSLIIRAEQLGRKGLHREALQRLVRLPERGLPVFSVGLSMAIDRLGLYLDASRSSEEQVTSEFDQADFAKVKPLLDRLRCFGAFAIYSAPYLTYSGLNPREPSAEVLPDNL
jgi:hypothetical protein